jgi:tetratricopeptide (TPR) repeat protein
LQRGILGDHHPDLSYALNNLGFVLLEKGDWAAAEPVLHENLELVRASLGENNIRFGAALNNCARVMQEKGDYDQAEVTFQRALQAITQANGAQGWYAAKVLANLGVLQFDRGDYPAAEDYARRALDMDRKLGGDENPALVDLAEARIFQADPVGAEPLLRQALAIRQKELLSRHPNVIAAEVRLGEALTAEGKAAGAEPILREALTSSQSAPFPLLSWQTAEVKSALGACLMALHRASEAGSFLRDSQADLQRDPRPAFRRPHQAPSPVD